MIDWKAPLRECRICPRACGIDRTAGKRGFCGAGALVRVARTMLHRWEEPCLIGAHGAGAVFFSHCTLRCVYCQNHEIRHGKRGDLLSVEELAARFLTLESQGAATLDLVTPTHYTPQILAALELARTAGFSRPVRYRGERPPLLRRAGLCRRRIRRPLRHGRPGRRRSIRTRWTSALGRARPPSRSPGTPP